MGKITKIIKTSFISFYTSKEAKHESIEEYREFSVGKILLDFFISIFSKEDSKLIPKKTCISDEKRSKNVFEDIDFFSRNSTFIASSSRSSII